MLRKCPYCKEDFTPLAKLRKRCYDTVCNANYLRLKTEEFKQAHPNYQKNYYRNHRAKKIDYMTNWRAGTVGGKHKSEFARIEASDLAVMSISHKYQPAPLTPLAWQHESPEKFTKLVNRAIRGL